MKILVLASEIMIGTKDINRVAFIFLGIKTDNKSIITLYNYFFFNKHNKRKCTLPIFY